MGGSCRIEYGHRAVTRNEHGVWIPSDGDRRQGSFVEKRKVGGGKIARACRFRQNRGKNVPHHRLVEAGYGRNFFGIPMFGNGESESTTPKVRAVRLFVKPLEYRSDLLSGRCRGGEHLMQRLDHALVARLQIGGHEMVFRGEVPIKRRFGDLGFFYDTIDADSPDAFSVEKGPGCVKDMVWYGFPHGIASNYRIKVKMVAGRVMSRHPDGVGAGLAYAAGKRSPPGEAVL